MNALELQGLTKHYKDFTLGPLDLTLPGGTHLRPDRRKRSG